MGAATCTGGTFDDGWIIFVDLNGDIQRPGGPNVDGGENVLRRHPPVDDAIDISMNPGATFFSFAPTGLGRGDQSGFTAIQTAVICDGRGNVVAAGGNSAARFLVVTPIGRATVLRDVAQITAAGGCP
jgi:Tfp pilus assembly protein FimT